MPAAVLARQAFALGYAEDGIFPIPPRAKTACLAVEHIAEHADSNVAHLIVEAGRAEGKRTTREAAHRRLYSFHTAELAAALATILGRVDTDTVTTQLLDTAAQHTAAGNDPVTRRRAVAGIAAAAIRAHIHPEDRQTVDSINSTGSAHAVAYGTGEAQATPPNGGPPRPAKIAAAAAAALAALPTAGADDTAAAWTDLEIQSIAMGAALAAGDGRALGDATRKVGQALVDTGRATNAYADQLHATVTNTYVSHIRSVHPAALFNWVTAEDPCPECIDNYEGNPYEAADVPGCPDHPNCRCDVEMAAQPAAAA